MSNYNGGMKQTPKRPRVEYHLLGLMATAVLGWFCWIGPPETAFLAFTALGPAWYCCYLRGQPLWASALTVMWFAVLIRSLMLPISQL